MKNVLLVEDTEYRIRWFRHHCLEARLNLAVMKRADMALQLLEDMPDDTFCTLYLDHDLEEAHYDLCNQYANACRNACRPLNALEIERLYRPHDLTTGYAVVRWLASYPQRHPNMLVVIHSYNEPGVWRMKGLLEAAGRRVEVVPFHSLKIEEEEAN